MQHEYAALLEELIRLLREEFDDRLRSVLLFGSVARGTARPDSDVDVCLVINDLPVSRYGRHQLLSPILELAPRECGIRNTDGTFGEVVEL